MIAPPPLHQLQLLLTERCNLVCTHCAVPEEDSPADHELSTEEWKRFASTVIDGGVETLVLSGGEALLRRDCLEIAEHALTSGARGVVIVTNGTVLPVTVVAELAALQRTWSRLRLHVSLDGCDAPSHDLIRGEGTFERTFVGLERLRSAGGRVDGVHTVLHRRNVDDLDGLAEQARRLGADTWTVFPVAALGRGVDLDHLRLSHEAWVAVLERFADHPPAGLDIGLMGPTVGDEWTDLTAVPMPRADHSPQACVGPDGAVFTCPPLRHHTIGHADAMELGAVAWSDVDAGLRSVMAGACPTCKYRSLCTGVHPGGPRLATSQAPGEPVVPVPVAAPTSASPRERPA